MMPFTFRRARTDCAHAALWLLLAIAPSVAAQQPTSAQANAIRQACRGDYMAHCASVPTGGAAALACLQEHAAATSAGCQQALRAVSGGAAKSAPAAPAATPKAANAVPASSAPRANSAEAMAGAWPHTITGDGGTATVYQPQVIAWPERQTLQTRMVVGLNPTGAKTPTLGTVEVSFATSTDLATRWVTLYDAKLVSTRFPGLDTNQAVAVEGRIKGALERLGAKRVPLDTLLVSLRAQSEKPPEIAVNNDPPAIFMSERPASLLVFDGEPVLAPIAGTPLSFVVNTNWDVFRNADDNTWYWLNNGVWLASGDVKSGWAVAKLPKAFSALPADANFADVKKQIPGRTVAARDLPAIFVSTKPAEIIVIDGAPQFRPVAGTSLQYVANTEAALFRDSANARYYYLVSGRWFGAESLAGPWTFATPTLPVDFARIPADSPRGFVLASVPGTPAAQEALLQAQIPQQATLNKETAKLDVVYSGAPKFEPIAGTPMQYAVNTSFNVVLAENAYYACHQGAWFVAGTPTGGWALASTVPAVIYTIPPASPLYPCTYVRVYTTTPTTVTYGYTAGYTMGYVTAGVVVYGTGWYYPPVIWPGPVPIYYPYPYSYAGAAYYNSATGAWARGGAIYGPYGGVVKGGTAYNPNTGAWAHGGAVYGPNGGAGAFSAYNPSTGSYAHGSAVYGPNGASGNASWYNARTGVSGSTNQNSNAYGRWGSSTVTTPNQTIHTQSQSNAQGSAGSFSSSTGAKGAAVSGAGGNSAGAVKTAGGDVYAGADGNVYKKTDSGWQKYDNGSWNQVQKPATDAGAQRGSASTANASTTNASSRQLDSDREARTTGAQRQQSYGAAQGGFGARGGGGGFQRGGGGGGFRR